MRRALILILLAASSRIPATSQVGLFVLPPQYPTPSPASVLAVGDFNGDGKLDIAVPGPCSGTCATPGISVLLGNGDGTFQASIDTGQSSLQLSSKATMTPSGGGMVAGDFNGDGKLDLAFTSAGAAFVNVFFGNGDGTFQPAVTYGTGNAPTSVAVGDFNKDGVPDLAVANSGSNSVSIFLNSGSGTFPSRQDFATALSPTFVTVGDFNKDGNLDVAVAAAVSGISGSVSILLGNGDGTFQTHVDYAVGDEPVWVAAADINGDGFLDLAVANAASFPGPGFTVTVLWGSGTGTFTSSSFATGNSPSSVVVGDFNGDGQLDFAVTNESDDTVSVFLNEGNKNFSPPAVSYGTDGPPLAMVAADFAGNHKLDLAVVGTLESVFLGTLVPTGVNLLLGHGDGTFGPTDLSYQTGSDPDGVVIADLNGDKKNDVAVANFNDNNVSVLLGNGDGTLQPRLNYATGNGPSSIASGDVNADGKSDLVVANFTDNTVSVLLNAGSGTFQSHVDYATATGPSVVVIGDLNGDGIPDLAVACVTSNNVSLLFGNGDGTFQTHSDFGVAGASGVAMGDFNGDGKLDFAVSGASTVTVFLNNGGSQFGSTTISTSPNFAGAVSVADFNGDGNPDLAVANNSSLGLQESPLMILLGNGDGTFQTPIVTVLQGSPITVGDLNGDGVPDIALGNQGYGFVTLALGKGDGTFQSTLDFPTAMFGGTPAAGDLNGDGKQDLLVANGANFGNTLTVLLTAGVASPTIALAVPAGGSSSATVSAGQPATYTLSIGGAGSAGTANLACSGAPTGATCSVPASQNFNATGATNFNVTVTTTARTAAALRPFPFAPSTWMWGCLLLGGVLIPRIRIRERKRLVCYVPLLLLGVIFLGSCGGGGGGSVTPPSGGTPAGSYSLTVTATDGSTTQSVPLTLIVQ